MKTTLRWLFGLGLAAAAALPLPTLAAPPLQTLQPGAFREIPQNLTVNIVLVGFDGANALNPSALRAALPGGYRPIHRYPEF